MVFLAKIKRWPLSISEQKIVRQLTILPNPVNSTFEIKFEKSETGTLSIYSLQGQLLFNRKIKMRHTENIDISDLKSGIYTVLFTTNKKNYVSKIIKN